MVLPEAALAEPCPVAITAVRREPAALVCSLSADIEVRLPASLGVIVQPGCQLVWSGPSESPDQFRVLLNSNRPFPELLFTRIESVTQPTAGRNGEYFLRARIAEPALGIDTLLLPCHLVRDHFYRSRSGGSLYAQLGISEKASLADLRLAYRLTTLEQQAQSSISRRDAERAFNILAHPELRLCHDAVAVDPETPVLFPYGGFGSLLAAGERSSDGRAFFARRITAFQPSLRKRAFRASFRRIEFFEGYALYRDSRRKAEVVLDPVSLPLNWDLSWNQWKHLAGIKLGISGTFVETGHYRLRSGEWRLIRSEAALPSRLTVSLPANASELIEKARQTYHRFGHYHDALIPLRSRIKSEPVERAEIERILSRLQVPGDFEPPMLTWRPDYEKAYYSELAKRARRIYLFRDEYLFEWQRGILAEIPEAGHATCVFQRPPDLDIWLDAYKRVTRQQIRQNRAGAAGILGFLGRVAHGRNPRTWIKHLQARADDLTAYPYESADTRTPLSADSAEL